MTSTAKAQLQSLWTTFDTLFSRIHPMDTDEVVAAIRKELTARKSGAGQSGYKDPHTSSSPLQG